MNFNINDFKNRLKEDNEPYYDLIINKINSKTGEIVESFQKGLKKKQPKKGWCIMYKKDMKQTLMSISNNPTALKVWIFLWDYMKKDGTIKMPKQKDIAQKLDSKQQLISRAIKKLQEEKIIAKIDNEWRYNPFIFSVSGMSDVQRYEAQQIWEEYIGYYKN